MVRTSGGLAVVVLLIVAMDGAPARGEAPVPRAVDHSAGAAAGRTALVAPAAPAASPAGLPAVPPGARIEAAGVPARRSERRESITSRGWFWAAVCGVVAATGAVLLVANRPPAPPKSNLGAMDAYGGR